MNIDLMIFEQLEDPESVMSEFVRMFTLRFILERLSLENRREFVMLLEEEQHESDLLAYLQENITNFETEYKEALAIALTEIKEKSII